MIRILKYKKTSEKTIYWMLIFTVLALMITACSEEVILDDVTNERGQLIAYTKVGSMMADNIVSINDQEGDISVYVTYDVDLYSIVYNSLYKSELIEVSGLVIVPNNTNEVLDLIQHHHGTIIPFWDDTSTPSLYRGGSSDNNEIHFLSTVMASNGYVVSMPDYAGYGCSKHLEHPYTIHHELAEVSVDMLRATKTLTQELDIEISNNVHLTGWSEGAGAGLKTHQYLQEQYVDEFNVMGSSLLAGPYDYDSFVTEVLTNDQVNDNFGIYSWSIYSLNQFSPELEQPNRDIYKYTVRNQLHSILVPFNRANGVFKASFLDNVTNGNDVEFIEAMRTNSFLNDWTPSGSVFFHSGTVDETVPHYNSVNAYEYFDAHGGDVTLYEYEGGDHYTPLFQYLTTTLDDFENL